MPDPQGAKCPRCDAAVSATDKKCPQCGRPLGAHAPGGLAAVPAKAAFCPTCKLAMYAATVGDQALLHCAECHGTAYGREALMKLQPHGPKQIELSAEERGYKRPPFFEPRKKPPFLICPLCGKRMKEEKLGGGPVDLCEACNALWLDGPKIERLPELIGPYKWKIANARKR